ncbi:MAG TPA: UDP-4-amino-4,6-dideoxy-N-acetyl-beta-L-altrosamine N-acetyltransferase [Solirubrobacteraceae bacterium]|nr:UDP-4-amino-4,6-dideoxy-N-acetyl-beta-L-altrosamine N-acetyltransferase [Solirubrobacteraceae bacterium]
MTEIVFSRLREEDLDLVRRWRSRADIEQWMYSPGPTDADAQRRWFQRVRRDPNSLHWVIRTDSVPVGVIHLEIEPRHRRASIGYYLGRAELLPIGGLVMAYTLNYAFARDDLALRKIVGEVFADNRRVLRLHELLGYRVVGTLRDHALKQDGWHDVVVFEIMREQWDQMRSRLGRYVAPFE